jgi:uncharacterized protein (UPF0332 family)
MTENRRALISYRLAQAAEALESARILLDRDKVASSVNRSYYAMFYAVLALLASRDKETGKHTGAISLFDKEFVKSGELPRELSRWLHDAFDLRLRSDYLGQPAVGQEEALATIQHAEAFLERLRGLLP